MKWRCIITRVELKFTPNDENEVIILPLDFRRKFISVIKKFTSNTEIFTRFELEKPGYSPYVFGVKFGKILNIDSDQKKIEVKPPVKMTISSGFYDFITLICNNAIKLKGKEIISGLQLADLSLYPLKKIKRNVVEFRTIGHAVFRKENGYLDNNNFQELEETINTHFFKRNEFLKEKYDVNPINRLEIIKVLCSEKLKKGVCYHYGGSLPTLQGSFVISSSPEVLQFIYDYGIGVRNGQGFGLLEVVREL